MEEWIARWGTLNVVVREGKCRILYPSGGTYKSGEDYEKITHCFTIDDDMVISKSQDKNEEFSSGKNTLFIAIANQFSPVQS